MTQPPDIFSFSDYRLYLSAWLKRARESKISNLSLVSKQLKVHTSFLAHVLAGTKNLSFEQATDLSEILSLTDIEREYFFALLQIERAGTHKLKAYWLEKKQNLLNERGKLKSRVGLHTELNSEDRAIFYSSWIYVAIFVATAISEGQSLEQIASRFNISRKKAEEILNFLVHKNICQIKNQKFTMGKNVIYLSNDSPLVVKHHTNWRMRAIQKMDERTSQELFFTSPMSMSQNDASLAREILADAIEKIHKICKDSLAEEVFCLNIDFFKGD